MGNYAEKNIFEEKYYGQYFQKALSIGNYYCRDFDLAQEVAQLTIIKLYLWGDQVVNLYQLRRFDIL
jgi:hypothetical protein